MRTIAAKGRDIILETPGPGEPLILRLAERQTGNMRLIDWWWIVPISPVSILKSI